VELEGALGKADVVNRMLDTLERDLEATYQAGDADAFMLYVYGLVLADRFAPPPLHQLIVCSPGAALCLCICVLAPLRASQLPHSVLHWRKDPSSVGPDASERRVCAGKRQTALAWRSKSL
jgi:hypothetical protein